MHTNDYIHQTESQTIHRRHRRWQFLRALFIMFVVLVAGWFILFLLALGQVAAAALDVRDAVKNTAEHVRSQRFLEGEKNLQDAARSLKEAEKGLYLLDKVWFLPGLKDDFSNFKGMFVAGEELVESLSSILMLGEDVVQLADLGDTETVNYLELPAATKKTILERLSTSSNDIDLLLSRIHIAKDELDLLEQSSLAVPFLGVLKPIVERVDEIDEQVQAASVFTRLLPEFFGLRTEKTHLLLFLNNDELRPGGGFIGTYGIMQVRDGEVLQIKTADVYAIDSAPVKPVTEKPPEPFQKYNAATQWFFRDKNWSPDFSVSAKKTIEAFEYESGMNVDSVIGFTPTFASELLAYLGPIEVSGQTFTSENVPELIEYQVEKGFWESSVPVAQRKEILADLVKEVQTRLAKLPVAKWGNVFSIVSNAFKTKQAAIFSENEQVQNTLANVGWAGVVSPLTSDIQMFVDANLASLKTDPTVKRSIRYSLFRNDSGQWIGRTSITYDHQGTFDWRTTRYRTYSRLYVPQGTELIRVVGLNEGPEISEELDMTVFGGFVSVEPKEERTVVYEYKLADSVIESIILENYSLTFYKQMGTRDYALTLDLDFDKNITYASPAENRNEWGDDAYRLNTKLSQDWEIEIGL